MKSFLPASHMKIGARAKNWQRGGWWDQLHQFFALVPVFVRLDFACLPSPMERLLCRLVRMKSKKTIYGRCFICLMVVSILDFGAVFYKISLFVMCFILGSMPVLQISYPKGCGR